MFQYEAKLTISGVNVSPKGTKEKENFNTDPRDDGFKEIFEKELKKEAKNEIRGKGRI